MHNVDAVRGDAKGDEPAGAETGGAAAQGARAADCDKMDHVWTFEAKISWDDFLYMNYDPNSSPYGDPPYGTVRPGRNDEDDVSHAPQFRWIVKDINAHMQSIGEHYRWNIRD